MITLTSKCIDFADITLIFFNIYLCTLILLEICIYITTYHYRYRNYHFQHKTYAR